MPIMARRGIRLARQTRPAGRATQHIYQNYSWRLLQRVFVMELNMIYTPVMQNIGFILEKFDDGILPIQNMCS